MDDQNKQIAKDLVVAMIQKSGSSLTLSGDVFTNQVIDAYELILKTVSK